jgi:phenylacetate-CoA ligase
VCVISDPARARSRRFRTQVVPVAWSPRQQLSLLQDVRPMVLKAWPSSVAALMHHTQNHLGRHIRPRIVALSGEQCSEGLREQIQSDLGAEVFVFYGAGEFGPIASECPAHDGLHISADELIVESLDGTGTSQCGELVITSLFARTMPYIRYRIGDLGTVCDGECSCGSSLPRLTLLRGQASRMIHLPRGERASVAAVVNTSLRCFPTLRKFCLIQNAIDRFVLQAVFLEPPDRDILQSMERRIRECLVNEVEVRIRVVNCIDVEGARKFGNFVCRLPEETHPVPRGTMSAGPIQRSNS